MALFLDTLSSSIYLHLQVKSMSSWRLFVNVGPYFCVSMAVGMCWGLTMVQGPALLSGADNVIMNQESVTQDKIQRGKIIRYT